MAKPINPNPTPQPTPLPPVVLGGAIGARYEQLGGTNWGYPLHEERPTTDGRGRYVHFRTHPQNPGSQLSIYWSPETGAHEVFGAIRGRWESLGWETSFLGYPTSGEQPTHDGAGRFQTFQGGMFVWHPDVGAFEVNGDIRTRYNELGGSVWGYPITDEIDIGDGRGMFNHFRHLESGGERSIYWTPQTGAHAVVGAIRDGWASYNWQHSALGYPTSDEMSLPSGGIWQTFEGGIYLWHPDTEAHEVHGPILERYTALGGSDWGYPITDDSDAKGDGRYNHFRELATGAEMSIHWSPTTGAVETYGAIRGRWEAMNWEHSHLGYPVGTEEPWPQGVSGSRMQQFQGGRILWQASDGATFVDPIELSASVPGGDGFGGEASLRLHSSGDFEWFGKVTNSAYQDYDYRIYGVATVPASATPGGIAGHAFAVAKTGEINMQVVGTNENRWSEPGHNPALAADFLAFQHATLAVNSQFRGGITSKLDDIVTTMAGWGLTAALGPLGLSVIYAGIELGAVATGGDATAGPRILAGTMWMMGPGGMLFGWVVDELARIGQQRRSLLEIERRLLTLVFNDKIDTVDLDAITLTDTAGLSGRPFTFPGGGPQPGTDLNMGDLYQEQPDFLADVTPTLPDGTPRPPELRNGYAKKLAHEATHAWHYRWMANALSYTAHGMFDSEYTPKPSSTPWSNQNIEQQATIVETWVQRNFQPEDTGDEHLGLMSDAARNDDYFHYIVENIRVGKT